MTYSEGDLRIAASAGMIGATDLERLLAFLSKRSPLNAAAPAAKFDVAHLFWYAGALIVIGAMGIFSTVAFSQIGGRALTACAIIYAVAFTLAGHHLWYRKNLRVPGGLLIAIAVSMAPLAVYGIQAELGWWGSFGRPGTVHDFYVWIKGSWYVWIKGSWIFMEIATIIAGVVALHFSAPLWALELDQYDRRQGRVRHPLGSYCVHSVFALHSVLLAEAVGR
jgi:hypothetical protein